MTKPRVGLLLGDPSGIGPELVAKLLAWPGSRDLADIFVIGDPEIYRGGLAAARLPDTSPQFLLYSEQAGKYALGTAGVAAGRYVLGSIRRATESLRQRIVDTIVFAPLNKRAMKLDGLTHSDELHYFADLLDHNGAVSEINVCGSLWTSRVTSHIPFRAIAEQISIERIHEAVVMIHSSLVKTGLASPRIAVAALNPHAGEGGLFRTEEIMVIQPAIEKARKAGMNVSGPWPADTLFVTAKQGRFDGIVTMYHDQGQIALKLLGFDRGVAVLGGLSEVIATLLMERPLTLLEPALLT